MITISITDQVTPALKAIGSAPGQVALWKNIGRSVSNLVKRHLIQRNRQGNKMGFPRTNFFAHAAESVNTQAHADGLDVGVSKIGVRQRLLGGTIRPVNVSLLTIPVHPSAYGHRAREFKDLKWGPTKGGPGLLYRPAKGKSFGEIYYILARQVTQKPDPTVLPDEASLAATVTKAIDRFMDRFRTTGRIR